MEIGMTGRLYAIAFVTVAAVVAFDVACDRIALTAPTGSTVTLTVDRNVLPLNGQTTLRAVVIESAGTPVQNGTMVTFSSTLGSISPQSVETANGIATATFNAGSISGSSFIRAFSGGAVSANGSAGGIEVKIGAAAAGSVAISATPPSVSQSGGTVTISALVMDGNNNPLPGAGVLFSATNGTLSASTAVSDESGIARVTLTTQSTSTVTATVGGSSAHVDVIVSTAPTITITAPDTAVAGTPVAVSITVTTGGSGNATPRQVQLLDVNYGDGTHDTRSNVTGSVGLTHTYTRQGGYTITATATDVSNNTGIASKGIVVSFAPQPTVTISASPNPVSRTGADKGVTVFTVTATADSSGAPVRSVRVTAQNGAVIYSNSGPVSSAQIPYRFTEDGTFTFTVTATDANGETATASTVVFVRE
jgi:adhesin/invasin